MRRILSPRNKIVFPRAFRKPSNLTLDLAHPLSRGLFAFWPLGDAGSIGFDIFGTNNSSAVNGPLSLAAGYNGGRATTFNGSNQALVPSNIGNAPTAFSVVCLANCTSTARQAYVAAVNSAVTQANFYFETNRFGGGFSGVFSDLNFTAPSANVWHAVAATFDGTNRSVYVDGISVASDSPGSFGGGVSAGDFAIGRLGSFTGGQFYGGQMEAVRIYDRALSPSEVFWLKNEPYAGVYALNANISGIASVDATVNLVGVSGTAAVGTLSASAAASVALTGVQAIAATGSLSVSAPFNVALSGVQAASAAGTLGVGQSRTIALEGVQADAAVGIFGKNISSTVALTGVSATAQCGTFAAGLVAPNVPMITIMNANPIPAVANMNATPIANEGDMPSQLPLETILSTTPIPMTGFLYADPVANEGSVP